MTRHTGRKPALVANGWLDKRVDRDSVRRVNLYMGGQLFTHLRDLAQQDELALSTLIRELICDGLAFRAIGSGGTAGAGAP